MENKKINLNSKQFTPPPPKNPLTKFLIISNIFLTLAMLIGLITFSGGWHIPEEILSGTFKGTYNFSKEVNFNDTIAFLAVKTAHQTALDTQKITFDTIITNKGESFNITTSTFTAPRDGIYFLYFDGLTQNVNTNGNFRFYKNGINTGLAGYGTEGSDKYEKSYGSAILELKKNDNISIHSRGTFYVYGYSGHYHTRFGGFLIR